MNLDKYQRKAMRTRDYPRLLVSNLTLDSITEAPYIGPAFELASEAAELVAITSGAVVGQLKKAIRKDGGGITPERLEALRDELGDVLWSLAAVADSVGLSLDDIAKRNLEKLKARASKGEIHADTAERSGDYVGKPYRVKS